MKWFIVIASLLLVVGCGSETADCPRNMSLLDGGYTQLNDCNNLDASEASPDCSTSNLDGGVLVSDAGTASTSTSIDGRGKISLYQDEDFVPRLRCEQPDGEGGTLICDETTGDVIFFDLKTHARVSPEQAKYHTIRYESVCFCFVPTAIATFQACKRHFENVPGSDARLYADESNDIGSEKALVQDMYSQSSRIFHMIDGKLTLTLTCGDKTVFNTVSAICQQHINCYGPGIVPEPGSVNQIMDVPTASDWLLISVGFVTYVDR